MPVSDLINVEKLLMIQDNELEFLKPRRTVVH